MVNKYLLTFEKNGRVSIQSQDSKSTFLSIVQLFPYCILFAMKGIPEIQERESSVEKLIPTIFT